MSIVDEALAKLRAECSDLFRTLGTAADMAALKDGRPTAMPAAYLYIVEEASDDNTRLNGPSLQRTEVDLGLMIITANLSDAKGGAAARDLEALKIAARRALVGWQPASADTPIENVGGKLVKANAGAVWWENTFGTAFFLEGTAT